jgi:hypothetical protein
MSFRLQRGTRARSLTSRCGAATKDSIVGIIVVPCTHEPKELTVDQLRGVFTILKLRVKAHQYFAEKNTTATKSARVNINPTELIAKLEES